MSRAPLIAILAVGLALAGCGGSGASSSRSDTSGATPPGASSTPSSTTSAAAQIGFEGVPIEQGPAIGSASSTGTGVVDGIRCQGSEQLAYHIHVHLAVFADGASRALPGGIGIPGSTVQDSAQGPVAVGGRCIYWLHTHAPDGVIHIESPTKRIYTLGAFFDEWRQPLSANQVATVHGTVSAIVNGRAWTRSPRAIPLTPHAVIQLSIGEPPVPFHPMSWAGLQL